VPSEEERSDTPQVTGNGPVKEEMEEAEAVVEPPPADAEQDQQETVSARLTFDD